MKSLRHMSRRCGICCRSEGRVVARQCALEQRFEFAVSQACENAVAGRVAVQFELPASTLSAFRKRYLERLAGTRRKPAVRQMGLDDIYLGTRQKFVTGVGQSTHSVHR
jgi:hypothetical protein